MNEIDEKTSFMVTFPSKYHFIYILATILKVSIHQNTIEMYFSLYL